MIGLAGLQAWRRVELDVEAVFIILVFSMRSKCSKHLWNSRLEKTEDVEVVDVILVIMHVTEVLEACNDSFD